jgi:S-adenosylmethionine:tRNA-ribosyltransferase-isomerase (queuine synthetase)
MKTRDICNLFLTKRDKSFVRNCIYGNIIKYEKVNTLQCMNMEREINISSKNFQMENDLVSIFEKICDKNLCLEFMCDASKENNATIIFLIANKIDKLATEKLSEDCYNWFLKSLTEKMVSLMNSMTMFSEKEWDVYLLGKPDETSSNIGETIIYVALVLWGIKTFKSIFEM